MSAVNQGSGCNTARGLRAPQPRSAFAEPAGGGKQSSQAARAWLYRIACRPRQRAAVWAGTRTLQRLARGESINPKEQGGPGIAGITGA